MHDAGVDTHVVFAGSSLRPGAPGFSHHHDRPSTEAELTMLGGDAARPAPVSASGTRGWCGVRLGECVGAGGSKGRGVGWE